jgi:hypothetical protein
VPVRGEGRSSQGATVGARERVPVGRDDVRERGDGRAPRGAAVLARDRLPVGLAYVRAQAHGWKVTELGGRERLPSKMIHA